MELEQSLTSRLALLHHIEEVLACGNVVSVLVDALLEIELFVDTHLLRIVPYGNSVKQW